MSSSCVKPEIRLMEALLEMMMPSPSTNKIPSGAASHTKLSHSCGEFVGAVNAVFPPKNEGLGAVCGDCARGGLWVFLIMQRGTANGRQPHAGDKGYSCYRKHAVLHLVKCPR